MSNPMTIATSGLLALQRAIATTSNNIVNVNTEGYNRQVVRFEPQPSQQEGGGFIGSGVKAGAIERVYNEYLVAQVHDFSASNGNLQTFSDLAARLDNVLGDPANGLSQNIQKFFGALHGLSNNPASIPERRVVLAEGEALTTQMKFVDNSLDQFRDEINGRLETLTDEISDLASNVAHINERIAALSDSSSNMIPNDLMDQRDLLLTELSSKVGISVVEDDSGRTNVFIGTGQPLVIGSEFSELTTSSSAFDVNRLEIVYQGGSSTTNITKSINGGELQGLLDFRDSTLENTRNRMGLLAVGLSESFNAQHRSGLDLNGNFGTDFFTPSSVAVSGHPANAGAATLTASVSDASQLEASDYLVRYDGSQWMAIRQSDDVVTTSAGSFTLDGMDITIAGGAPAAGDSFLVRATHGAVSALEVAVKQPGGLAAAAPLRSLTADSNLGDIALSELDALNTSALSGDITLTFDADALGVGLPGFIVSGAATGTIAYDPATESAGKQVAIAGVADFTLAGTPAVGDTLVLQNNVTAGGDNRNALRLAGLQNDRILESGETSYQGYYGNMVADVGVKTRQSEVNAATEASLLSQAESTRDSVSGVNLEEEAANLLRFQQAYQAAAQVVAISDSLFQTLLRATGR